MISTGSSGLAICLSLRNWEGGRFQVSRAFRKVITPAFGMASCINKACYLEHIQYL